MPYQMTTMEAFHGTLLTKKAEYSPMSFPRRFDLAQAAKSDDLELLYGDLWHAFGNDSRFTKRSRRLISDLAVHVIPHKGMDSIAISSYAFGKKNAAVCAHLLTRMVTSGFCQVVNPRGVFYSEKNQHNRAATYRFIPEAIAVFERLVELQMALDDEANPLNPVAVALKKYPNMPACRLVGIRARVVRLRKEEGSLTPEEFSRLRETVRLQCGRLNTNAPARYVKKAIRLNYRMDIVKKYIDQADSWLPKHSGYRTKDIVTVTPNKQGIIYKCGMRHYNDLCSTPNEDHSDLRTRIVGKMGLGAMHIDVKSSIGNVRKAMAAGEITPFTDQYSNIGRHLYADWDGMPADVRAAKRKLIKKSYMKCNFGEFAAAAFLYPRGRRALSYVGRTNKAFTYGEFQAAMKAAGLAPCGLSTEVFYAEGAIYGIARYYLLTELGIRSLCVYDSFYLSDVIDNDVFISILNKAFYTYLDIMSGVDNGPDSTKIRAS